jgi:hypothetical protein
MTADTPQRIKAQRETQGLTLQALAALSCLSVRQVQQIEEGGLSAFYNEDIKRKATEKVMGVLGLDDQPCHDPHVDPLPTEPEPLMAGVIRAEAHHPLAVPPDLPQSAETEASADDEPTQVGNGPTTRAADSSPDIKTASSGQWLLWLVILGTVAAVVYGLGLLPA